MADKFDQFSMADLMALAASPAGQQLQALVQRSDNAQTRQAMQKAAAGDMAGAKTLIAPLLADPQVRALLEQLGAQ